MGKYYCDYCDVHLTHDSASVRKAHNSGRNHLTNVREYYASLGSNQAQDMIDQIARKYDNAGPGMTMRPPPFNQGMMGGPMRQFGPPGGFGGPPGGGYGGPPPGFNQGGPPMGMPMRQFGPPPGQFGGQPPPMGMGGPSQGYGQPPMGMNGGPPPGFRPPPGMAPPPGFFPPPGTMGSPGGASFSSGPTAAPAGGESGAAAGGKLVNGLNPERARMLGLL